MTDQKKFTTENLMTEQVPADLNAFSKAIRDGARRSAIEEAIALAEDQRSKAHNWKTDYSHQDDVKIGRVAALDELIDALRNM